jgi:glycerophosphoryl diester phosphodiesterase
MRRALLALALLPARPGAGDPPATDAPTRAPLPIVIAHRGASGHRPEHTLAAYELAVRMGADYVEPDLVRTKDGVLVARHENEIGGTTDVAAKFPDRRRTQIVDGETVSGWFVEDFTLAELKTLRTRERLASRSHAHDGEDAIPTFDEVLALAARLGRERGRPVGVYPETKHPTHFRGIGLPLEEPLVETLRRAGLDRADAPVFIQSFERTNLQALRGMTRVRLVQLVSPIGRPWGDSVSYASMLTPAGLRAVRAYADAIGAEKRLVLASDAGATPSSLVRDAHAAGLLVHVWTLRSDAPFLAARWGGDAAAEHRAYAAAGVDGIFTDFPDDGVRGLRPAPAR